MTTRQNQQDESAAWDLYADQFMVTITPFGANLSFAVREAHPGGVGRAPQARHLGTIRVSQEHLKVMVAILLRQIKQYERQAGVSAPVSLEVLNQLGISPEDWEQLWK
ncbi:MAG: hypothetical protein HYU30_07060 [Chloroflexi bacterium]|nr:hypothetical protein [Chloroflexota bacterium]